MAALSRLRHAGGVAGRTIQRVDVTETRWRPEVTDQISARRSCVGVLTAIPGAGDAGCSHLQAISARRDDYCRLIKL